MFGVSEWLAVGAAAVFLGLGGTVLYQRAEIKDARADLFEARSELATCGGRLANILEDVESDNEIDALPDDALRSVPDHWLRPEGAGDDP